MTTLKSINKGLAPKGVELVKGEGYFYFVGSSLDSLPSTSVMVYRLNQLTKEQWLVQADDYLKQSKEN